MSEGVWWVMVVLVLVVGVVVCGCVWGGDSLLLGTKLFITAHTSLQPSIRLRLVLGLSTPLLLSQTCR